MKTLCSILFALLIVASAFAQAPQGISYQGIAFAAGGAPVVSGNVGVKISILTGSASGNAVYVETHTKATNAQGLFNLTIGGGAVVSGTFSNISWAGGDKYLKVELDPAGGTNYTSVGANQLLSVPYALYAQNVENIDGALITGGVEPDSIGMGVMTSSYAYAFDGTWHSQSLNGTAKRIIATSNNIGVMTTSYGYAFDGSWHSQSLNGTSKEIIGNSGNVAVLTTSYAYAFENGSWTSQSLNGTVQDIVASRGTFGVMTTSYAYAFNNGQWYSQSLNGTVKEIIAKGAKVLVFTTSYAYVFDSATNQWSSQSLNGTVLDYAH